MYRFVDTVPGSGTGSTSLSLQTILNGINLDNELTDENGNFVTLTVSGRSNITQRISTIDIPGLDGVMEEGNSTVEPRRITVKFKLSDKTNEGFRNRLNRLNSLLEGSRRVLKFTDENAIFYATLEVLDIPEEESNDLICNMTYLCSDPYKYGEEVSRSFVDDVDDIENKGTAPAKSIIELEALQPTTFAMIQNQDEEYMMIGRPIVEREIPTNESERVLVDQLSTLVGWSPLTAGEVLPGGIGIVGGTMRTTGNNFEAESFGANPNGWVGPAVKKSFSEPLQNFAIDVEVTSRNLQGQTGKLMALFLDASNNPVGTVTLLDGTIGRPQNNAVFTIGNQTILNESGENHGAYNNETVHLNLSRNGRTIVAYAYKESGGVRTGRIRREFQDDLLEYQTPIVQIVLYIAKYKEYVPFPMSFNALVVDKLYQLSDLEIPYIANAGDIITIDGVDENILINGENRIDLKDFGASYFSLKPGENRLTTYPAGAFKTKIRYRPPYK